MGEKSHRTIQLRKESRDGKSKGQVISRFAAGHALSAWASIAKGGEVNSVYIIEDDGALRVELARLFELNGFAVRLCERFDAAAQLALLERPDCILLDLKLPGVDGLSVCRAIRAKDSTTPIIVLTSSDTEFDEVMSMNLGADDYVTKPYSPAVLLARVRSALRRSQRAAEFVIAHRGVRLDIGSGEVSFGAREAELTRNELRILHLLMRNPGVVITRQEIMVELWESDEFIDDNTLTVNVNRLRRTLASIGVPDDFLVTKRGVGYRV